MTEIFRGYKATSKVQQIYLEIKIRGVRYK